MSSTTFATSTESVRVAGMERHHYSGLVKGAFFASLGPISDYPPSQPSRYRKFIPEGSRLHRSDNLERDLKMMWGLGEDKDFTGINGDDLFTVQLNSAIRLGGDALRLAARLHGQCEIHCYVEGPDRAWLADIIDQACKDNIFRLDFGRRQYDGYEALTRLLRSADDEPVVCSHSSSNSFPYSMVPDEDEEDDEGEGEGDSDEDGGDEGISKAVLWQIGLAVLRSEENKLLRIDPANWATYRFGNGTSGFDLQAEAWKIQPGDD